MRIVYSISSIANSGGIERVLCTKANYLAERLGYEVHIVMPKQVSVIFFPFSSEIHIHSLEVRSAPSKWNLFGLNTYQKEYKEKLNDFLFKVRPDITISFFGQDADFLYQIQDGSIKVLEFHFTKNYLKYLGESLVNDRLRLIRKYWLRYLMWREERLTKKYDHVVLLTGKDKGLWGGKDKFQVIPNPLSFESETVSPLNQKRIVSMGRLVLPKGFQYLIRAFGLIKECEDWILDIYGEGQDKDYLIDLIKSLSLQNRVFVKSPVKEVKEVLLDTSLFVFPSRYEGFGLVLTEAMECGVPCIAFDCECGPSDIIRNNEDGIIVPLDDVEVLSKKMECLMLDVDLRTKMGEKAKKNVQRFQVDSVMKRWDEYFQFLLNKKEAI